MGSFHPPLHLPTQGRGVLGPLFPMLCTFVQSLVPLRPEFSVMSATHPLTHRPSQGIGPLQRLRCFAVRPTVTSGREVPLPGQVARRPHNACQIPFVPKLRSTISCFVRNRVFFSLVQMGFTTNGSLWSKRVVIIRLSFSPTIASQVTRPLIDPHSCLSAKTHRTQPRHKHDAHLQG